MTVQEALELIRNAVYGEEVRGAICDAIETIDDVAENLIPPFEPTDSYEAGDLVFHEDDIYKFTQAHTGTWTGTDVVQTSIHDELETKVDPDGTYPDLTAGNHAVDQGRRHTDHLGQDHAQRRREEHAGNNPAPCFSGWFHACSHTFTGFIQ